MSDNLVMKKETGRNISHLPTRLHREESAGVEKVDHISLCHVTPPPPHVQPGARMSAHAWNDSDWCSISLSVWFPGCSLPVSGFCSQSHKHAAAAAATAAATSNGPVITHITDIKRNELKSLRV